MQLAFMRLTYLQLINILALGALAASVAALNPITVQEQEFIDPSTGDRFVVIGRACTTTILRQYEAD
jgi:hypothetical protein